MRWRELLQRALGGEQNLPPFRGGHSSPHTFDRFDSSRIGTGEGAQVYGHGLYFAENPAVAQAYRDSTARTNWRLDNQDWGEYFPGELLTADERAIAGQLRSGRTWDEIAAAYDARRRSAESAMRTADQTDNMEQYIAAEDWLRRITEQEATILSLQQRGLARELFQNSYDVNLHLDPARVLNFDTPIAQQSQQIQDVARGFGGNDLDLGSSLYSRALEARMGKPEDYSSESAYLTVRRRHSPAAAQDLQERGIEGWVYNDQGSRGMNTPQTYNMVVPPGNESRIEILRRWGLLPFAGVSAYDALGGTE